MQLVIGRQGAEHRSARPQCEVDQGDSSGILRLERLTGFDLDLLQLELSFRHVRHQSALECTALAGSQTMQIAELLLLFLIEVAGSESNLAHTQAAVGESKSELVALSGRRDRR